MAMVNPSATEICLGRIWQSSTENDGFSNSCNGWTWQKCRYHSRARCDCDECTGYELRMVMVRPYEVNEKYGFFCYNMLVAQPRLSRLYITLQSWQRQNWPLIDWHEPMIR